MSPLNPWGGGEIGALLFGGSETPWGRVVRCSVLHKHSSKFVKIPPSQWAQTSRHTSKLVPHVHNCIHIMCEST